MKLSDFLQLELTEATDSHARLAVHGRSAGQAEFYQGKLRGPDCRYARTLPSSLPVKQTEASEMRELLIIDPCYWSPRMPFLYRFEVDVSCEDGTVHSLSQQFGLRRWEASGASLRLEGRRTVLRGSSISADAIETDIVEKLAEARQAEIAGIVIDPSEALLTEASAAGVNLLADLRACEDLAGKLRTLSWQPAVAFAIVDATAQNLNQTALEMKLVQALDKDSSPADFSDWASVLLIELDDAERPPSWLADCGRPVIVRRQTAPTADCAEVRAACDRLQAELAPEFDFAGYFVG